MKKGEIYQGRIEKIDFPNKGKVTVEDKTVIVKNGIPGQTVRFLINKKKGKRMEGRLLEVLEKSPLETRKAVCSIFPQCGGCMYQTMSYEDQLEMKKNQVKDLLDQALLCGGQVDANGRPDYVFEALMNLHIEIRWSSLLEMNTKTVLWRSGCIKKEVPMMC